MISSPFFSYFRIALIGNLFYLLSIQAFALHEIQLEDSSSSFLIEKNIFVLHDPTGNLTFPQIVTKGQSFAAFPIKNLNTEKGNYWFKFSLKNNSSYPTWYLEIGNPYTYKVDFYEETSNGMYKPIHVGSGIDFNEREVKSNHIIIPLNLPFGTSRTYYLQTTSPELVCTSLKMATMQELYENHHPWDLINSIYFGLLFALMIYNLFVFISIKDITYLFYVFYTLFIGLQVACYEGYGSEFLWPGAAWMNSPDVYCALSIIFLGFFTSSFLHVKHYAPYLQYLKWILFGMTFFFLIAWTSKFKLIMLFPFSIYVFISGLTVYKKGFAPAKYYLIGFGSLIAGISISLLLPYGIIPADNFTTKAMQMGSALEAIVLSFALAENLRFYKVQKEEAQNRALEQVKQFSHRLIQSQENERKRIAGELHDSIGQSLIMIKNKVLMLGNKEQGAMDVNGLTEIITDAIQEVRSISYGLRPFQLDLLGLSQSIKGLIEDVSEAGIINFKIQIENIDGLFSKDGEINIYRIIQECLNNIVKHSGAKEAALFIRKKNKIVEISIEDYGKGISHRNSELNYTGFGFIGIKERLNILKGKITIENAIPVGTSIFIILPILEIDSAQSDKTGINV